MRVTILMDDSSVAVDGEGYGNLDLSAIDPTVHAVQWYETHGEVEHKDPVTMRMTENRTIDSFDEFQPAITAWQVEKDRVAAAIAAMLAEQATPVGGEPNVIAE